jgi:hypothetical protein
MLMNVDMSNIPDNAKPRQKDSRNFSKTVEKARQISAKWATSYLALLPGGPSPTAICL